LVEQFQTKLASRGARGLIGLAKQFKIMDDDRSMDLDMYEFKKAVKDFRVAIMEKDIDRLFNIFDRDRSGKISYDEFLRAVRVSAVANLLGRHEWFPSETVREGIPHYGQG
jgi:Ca2+-binding EF-hand superfamily protein